MSTHLWGAWVLNRCRHSSSARLSQKKRRLSIKKQPVCVCDTNKTTNTCSTGWINLDCGTQKSSDSRTWWFFHSPCACLRKHPRSEWQIYWKMMCVRKSSATEKNNNSTRISSVGGGNIMSVPWETLLEKCWRTCMRFPAVCANMTIFVFLMPFFVDL